MEQAEILILTLIMEEIIEDLYSKVKENFKLGHFHHKQNINIDLLIFKVNHFIILEMELAEIVILCNLLNLFFSSNEGGIMKAGNRLNYLKYLRAPI